MNGLCRFLFHDLGFRGNQKDYYDPRNSYLNEVLDRRTGLPILLSAVAMAIGTRAGLHGGVMGALLPTLAFDIPWNEGLMAAVLADSPDDAKRVVERAHKFAPSARLVLTPPH